MQTDAPLAAPPHIILASLSPRRKALLAESGLTFHVVPSDFDETVAADGRPEQVVRELALGKAETISRRYPSHWVIGADTAVVLDDDIFGKPEGAADAARMLERLSGKVHRVLTGYAVLCHRREHRFVDLCATEVTFKTLTPREIEWYIQTDEPFDKAGAYAIQGLGAFLVRRINGSYPNVVGLPVNEVVEHLLAVGAARMAATGSARIESVA